MRAACLAAALLLNGCGSLITEGGSDLAGIAGAGIAGAVTRNATAGAAIGLGVRSLADAGMRQAERRVHRAEQDRIAAVAGGLAIGAVGSWSVSHDIAIEPAERGSVVVTRTLGDDRLTCREIVFSVDGDTRNGEATDGATRGGEIGRGFYIATVCRDGGVWKWASAEPATERWGSLQ